MADLVLTPNLDTPDDIYEALLTAHEGLSKHQSDALNARLLLILVNHIGDREVIEQAISAARAAKAEG